MRSIVMALLGVLAVVAVLGVDTSTSLAADSPHADSTAVEFPRDIRSYDDADLGMVERLTHRVNEFPFNLVGTLLFVLAIAHTFLTARFRVISHRMEHAHEKKVEAGELTPE